MKLFGLDMSFSGDEPKAKAKAAAKKPAEAQKPTAPNELALSSSTIKVLIEQALTPAGKIELLKLYEAALHAPSCPMSPALSNYILDIGLNHDDRGVRRAARSVVIKTLAHDTILPAWDSNRDGQA